MCTCDQDPLVCAVCLIEDFVHYAKHCGWDFSRGRLFPHMKLLANGTIKKKLPIKLETWQISADLRSYMKEGNFYEGETPQSFRSGGAVDQLLKGKRLEEVMYTAYWKNPVTAFRYTRILEVMCPKGIDWKLIEKAGIDVSSYHEMNKLPLNMQLDQWRAFI